MVNFALDNFPQLKSLYKETKHSNYGHNEKRLSIFSLQLRCKIFKNCFEELHES